MNVAAHPITNGVSAQSTFTVLVTGANSGLGFAICCRLLDEFLFTRPQSQTLHLLFSTRDERKSRDTLARLNQHLQKTLREANGKTLGISLLLEARVKIEGVLVDLTDLSSVKKLAGQLRKRGERINACVWNAGIGGWTGKNWLQAVWTILTGIKQATCYPVFQYSDVGALAPQKGVPPAAKRGKEEEDVALGQVFTANVFGHYMLTHWLAPLMDRDSRVVWTGSTSGLPKFFSLEDIQCLRSTDAYESSKRLTDILVLTSNLPSTAPYTRSFLQETEGWGKPTMYLTHPGIVKTSISDVPWILEYIMLFFLYVSRWVGSPWLLISPYKAAVSACFCVLCPPTQLPDREVREGKAKWGSVTDQWGNESVKRTEVEGWGYSGKVGKVPEGSCLKGRWSGLRVTGMEEREGFEVQGREVWRELEEMREEWEGRLRGVGVGGEEEL